MIYKFYRVAAFWCLLAVAFTIYPQAPVWEKLNTPVSVTLKYMCFIDSLRGWAAGDSGTIIHTSDGGINWQIQNSTIASFIVDIFFIDEHTGWALTVKDVFPFNTIILKTTNGGTNWDAEDFQDTTALMRTIFFHDTLNGFIGGSYIAYTSDGGSSWINAGVDSNLVSNYPVYKFRFYNRQFGYACGGALDHAGVIWKTTNYGINWTAQGVSADQVFDLAILDSSNAIALSGDPEGFFPATVIKTTNAGISWNYEELLFSDLSFSIDFRTWNEGWSASGFRFLFTIDKGDSWNISPTPDSTIVFSLQFTDARTGYAAGTEGTILKLDPTTVNVEAEENPANEFYLYQNYPNPFNSSTKIKFTTTNAGTHRDASLLVTLKVYDMLGNEVAVLVDEYKQAGYYEVEFQSTAGSHQVASGIYFYQLSVRNYEMNSDQVYIQTKKMIYLK